MQLSEKKVFVALGFHINCNHSYRGDRNEDNGFGHDIRIIRGIIKILDEANRNGLSARGVWDADNYWSLENVLPRFAPDVIADIRRRVDAGHDEVILGNWGNSLSGAMTEDELEADIARSISNPKGSGVMDLFGKFTPFIRTQESMFTQGAIERYLKHGVSGIGMYYSAVPFDGMRNFVPPLTPNQRYNPLALISSESDATMRLLPMYSHGDILDNISLERWLQKIRRQQKTGSISGHALLYVNMDADAEIWTGMEVPSILKKLPNVKGLEEFIEVVNRLPYAEFTSVGEYFEKSPPVGTLRLNQDTADGSFCGYNSWSEKAENQKLWTIAQRGRWYERICRALLEEKGFPEEAALKAREALWGPGRSYFEAKMRMVSTTHFGLAGPLMNDERLRVAYHYARRAQTIARKTAYALAPMLILEPPVPGKELRVFYVTRVDKYNNEVPESHRRALVKAPLFFAPGECRADCVRLLNPEGMDVPFDLIGAQHHPDGSLRSATLAALAEWNIAGVTRYAMVKSETARTKGAAKAGASGISNGMIHLNVDARGRIDSLRLGEKEFATAPFITMAVTYRGDNRPVRIGFRDMDVEKSYTGVFGRVAGIDLTTIFEFTGANNPHHVSGEYSLMMFDGLPYLFVDGRMDLPLTPAKDEDTSLPSYIKDFYDSRWVEVMPAEITPDFHNREGEHLRVWKHNFLNATNSYELNYGEYDPRNRNLDSFNNHATDGWVAVSNGESGLLVAHDQTMNSAFAMCPMRLRDVGGKQTIYLNPFGVYAGGQMSQSPDGNGAARELTTAIAPQLRSMAPSFNGAKLAFRLMIAPYEGDRPGDALIADAEAFSMPPATIRFENEKPVLIDDERFEKDLNAAIMRFGLDETEAWEYPDFLEAMSREPASAAGKKGLPKLPAKVMLRLARDLIRGYLDI